MEKLVLTMSELPAVLGIGRSKAYELSQSEGFPSVRLGKRIVIPVDSLKAWLAEHAQQVTEKQFPLI